MRWLSYQKIFVLLLTLSLIGCTSLRPYKMDIQQGNILEPEKVAQLQVGMNRAQVHQLLGTPMLDDAFQKEHWNYIYYSKPGYGKLTENHILITFKDGKVSDIKSSS